jgi:hypothetical protein
MVAIGPKRTSLVALHMSALGGKADMTRGRCPLLQSQLGVKRTLADAVQMSAFDPKRTLQLFGRDPSRCIVPGCYFAPNDVNVTAQVIHLVREG